MGATRSSVPPWWDIDWSNGIADGGVDVRGRLLQDGCRVDDYIAPTVNSFAGKYTLLITIVQRGVCLSGRTNCPCFI